MFGEPDVYWLWGESHACQYSLLSQDFKQAWHSVTVCLGQLSGCKMNHFFQTISSQRGWHATEEWSGTPFLSVCSSSCLQFLKRQSICAPEYFYHVSLWASCFVILTFHLVPGWPDLELDEKLFICRNNCNVGYTPNAKHFISAAF